jgi:hypothetical protein
MPLPVVATTGDATIFPPINSAVSCTATLTCHHSWSSSTALQLHTVSLITNLDHDAHRTSCGLLGSDLSIFWHRLLLKRCATYWDEPEVFTQLFLDLDQK